MSAKVIPKLLPGEIFQGWLGRLRIVNALGSVQNTHVMLKRLALGMSCDKERPDFLDHAAVVLGTTRGELVRHHTLAPFNNAVAVDNRRATGSTRHVSLDTSALPLRISSGIAAFCRACVLEDLAFRGYSYWRRDHLLPGAHWCQKHRTPLAVAGMHYLLGSPPQAFFDLAQEYQDATTLFENEVLQRYVMIAEAVLDSALSADRTTISGIVKARLEQMGLGNSSWGNGPTVSQFAKAKLPLTWLSNTFPRIQWQYEYVPVIDNACLVPSTSFTTATLCLFGALLYEDAEQAIREIFFGGTDGRSGHLPRGAISNGISSGGFSAAMRRSAVVT